MQTNQINKQTNNDENGDDDHVDDEDNGDDDEHNDEDQNCHNSANFPLSLGDLGDQKYFYQWNSEKRK